LIQDKRVLNMKIFSLGAEIATDILDVDPAKP
jgi:hypothetical protein